MFVDDGQGGKVSGAVLVLRRVHQQTVPDTGRAELEPHRESPQHVSRPRVRHVAAPGECQPSEVAPELTLVPRPAEVAPTRGPGRGLLAHTVAPAAARVARRVLAALSGRTRAGVAGGCPGGETRVSGAARVLGAGVALRHAHTGEGAAQHVPAPHQQPRHAATEAGSLAEAGPQLLETSEAAEVELAGQVEALEPAPGVGEHRRLGVHNHRHVTAPPGDGDRVPGAQAGQ